MIINRFLQDQIQITLLRGKVLVLYGPRQIGKTTLVRELLNFTGRKTRFVNADELLYREALASQNRQTLGELFGFEFKWRAGAIKGSTRKEFLTAYPNAKLETVGQDNFVAFLQ